LVQIDGPQTYIEVTLQTSVLARLAPKLFLHFEIDLFAIDAYCLFINLFKFFVSEKKKRGKIALLSLAQILETSAFK